MARVKKIGLLVMSLLAVILSGCGNEKLEAFLKTDFVQIVQTRIDANKAIVSKLEESGLISASEKKNIYETIDSQMAVYTKDNEIVTSRELQKNIMRAVVDWAAPDYDPQYGIPKEEWDDYVFTRAVSNGSVINALDIKLLQGQGSNIVPLPIIDGKTADMVNERFGYKVYVLKSLNEINGTAGLNEGSGGVAEGFTEGGSSKNKGTSESGGTSDIEKADKQVPLDEVIAQIEAATNDKDKVDNSILDKYFKEAVDSNGKSVTLLDLAKEENRVVDYSSGSPLVSDSVWGYDKGTLKEVKKGNKVVKAITESNKKIATPDLSQPGKDMVVKDVTGQIPLLALRFYEFDYEAIVNVIEKLGMNPDQYLFTNYDGENRVYIMEYPVHKVKEFKEEGEDKFNSVIDKSNMGINLRNGKLIKYPEAWGGSDSSGGTEDKLDSITGKYMENSDSYLTVDGAVNSQDERKSAFIIYGDTPKGMELVVGERKVPIVTGRIVLRDYLEMTYAPSVVQDENIVVFGRKIRLTSLSGEKSNRIGYYVDKDGNRIEDGTYLYINDFADFGALNSVDNPEVRYIGKKGEKKEGSDGKKGGAGKDTGGDTSGDTGGDTEGTVDNGVLTSLSKIEGLKHIAVSSIKPTEQFPGEFVGKVDVGANEKPLFYGIVVKKNIFETSLFSGWINNSSDESSLNWWVNWLADKSRDYAYTINQTSLENYLNGNYTYELQQEGVVVLNLHVIEMIQKEIDYENKVKTTALFNTIFRVLGWVLVAYSFILMGAWLFDITVDIGINLLGKLTFGNLYAIKDIEEMPIENIGSERYVGIKGIMKITLGMIALGLVVMFVGVIDLIMYLFKAFGKIGEMITDIISGI